MPLRTVSLDELTIEDEKSFSHVAVYAQLKSMLRKTDHRFHIPDDAHDSHVSWDRALFLNLTFWNADEGADVLAWNVLPTKHEYAIDCASGEIEPRLIAPLQNRLTISAAGSTSEMSIDFAGSTTNSKRPRSVMCRLLWSLMRSAYSW